VCCCGIVLECVVAVEFYSVLLRYSSIVCCCGRVLQCVVAV